MEAVLELKAKPFKAPRKVGVAPVKSVGVAQEGYKPVENIRAEASQHRYRIPEDAYDLDIALDLVNTMWVFKCREYRQEIDPDKKQKLLQEADMMQFERNALYKGGEMQRSVMDKAFRLYSPIIKAHYAKV